MIRAQIILMTKRQRRDCVEIVMNTSKDNVYNQRFNGVRYAKIYTIIGTIN